MTTRPAASRRRIVRSPRARSSRAWAGVPPGAGGALATGAGSGRPRLGAPIGGTVERLRRPCQDRCLTRPALEDPVAPRLAELSVGDAAPSLTTPPLSRTMFVRYAGASGDFNPMHHDDGIA